MNTLRSKLTYANVTVTAALFLALGGTGYAASQLPRNSVGAAQISRGAVTSSEVRDGSLRSRDFAPGTLPRGPQGERGPQGPAGVPDTSDLFTKAESDARFVRGPGSITTFPVLDLPNQGSGTLADVPGVGRLEVRSCGWSNMGLHYVNRSGAPQSWVLAGSYHARLNLPADSGSVEAGEALDNVHNDAADIVRLTVAGGRTATFDVTRANTENGRCLVWGQALAQ